MPKPSTLKGAAGYADQSRSLQLDFIRGFAILMVLGRHPTWFPQFAGGLEGFATVWGLFGLTAIDLFFVLSGFLITGLLLEEAGEIHNFPRLLVGQSVHNLNQFAGNRAHIKKLIRHDHSGRHVVGITPHLFKAEVIAPSYSDSSQ